MIETDYNEVLPAPMVPEENEPVLVSEMEQTYLNCQVSTNEYFPPEDYIFEVGGVKIFPKGNIAFIKAKAKSGKTLAISVMTAAALCGELWQLKCLNNDCKVMVIDTEQARRNTVKFKKRVLKMAELDPAEAEGRLTVINLREMNFMERRKMLSYAIQKEHPDIVFVDGIVDLSESFNDEKDSMRVIGALMKLSSKYNCMIVNVLHTNPGSDKMRGHLGTIADQKASDVLQVEYDGTTFKVSTTLSREAKMPSWSFIFGPNGDLIPVDCTSATSKVGGSKKEFDMKKKMEQNKAINQFIADNGGSISKKELVRYIMDSFNIGRTAAYDRINSLDDMIIDDRQVSVRQSESESEYLPTEAKLDLTHLEPENLFYSSEYTD